MASFMKEFEHLEIQLEDIKSATNNFDESKVIGIGGFGKVYKGELSHSKGRSMVALKRLDRKHGQGDVDSGRDDMILVYEYASRGSLDGHLKDVTLTWRQRINICLDAAKGISYLYDPKETYKRLIHYDIKSVNILLDENFNAKVTDFGLSKIGPANPHNSILVTGALEKSYEENKLDEINLQDLMQLRDPSSLKTFSDIVFQCLHNAREERPTMSRVVEKLEIALCPSGALDEDVTLPDDQVTTE
ncbi:kinase-like domain, phloem protein 2-like protein [Tanacetum coccineum]